MNVVNTSPSVLCHQVDVIQSSTFSSCLFYPHRLPYLEAEQETETLQTLRTFMRSNAKLNKRYEMNLFHGAVIYRCIYFWGRVLGWGVGGGSEAVNCSKLSLPIVSQEGGESFWLHSILKGDKNWQIQVKLNSLWNETLQKYHSYPSHYVYVHQPPGYLMCAAQLEETQLDVLQMLCRNLTYSSFSAISVSHFMFV